MYEAQITIAATFVCALLLAITVKQISIIAINFAQKESIEIHNKRERKGA